MWLQPRRIIYTFVPSHVVRYQPLEQNFKVSRILETSRQQPLPLKRRRAAPLRLPAFCTSPSPLPPPTSAKVELTPTLNPLPAPSRFALASASGLFAVALILPAALAARDANAQHLAFLPRLIEGYGTHYQIILYTALFGILHSGLASLRKTVTQYVGERLYRVVFALSSLPAAGFLISYFIAHRYDGAQLWQIQGMPGVHGAVYAASFASFLLLYPATFNLAEVAAILRPSFRMYETGVTRITRHPQLWGQVIWCVAHSAWMGSSFTVVASLCLVAHHCFGAWNGDRRQRDAFGEEWFELEKRTSILPFVAVFDGRQRLDIEEFLRPAYVGVVAFVLGSYAAHPYVLRLIGGLNL